MLGSVILAIPLFTAAMAQTSVSCRNSLNDYCCHGSIISSDGSSDISKLICCVGDPIDNSINLGEASTCTAGSAVPLTQAATMSGASMDDGGSTMIVIGSSTVVGGTSASTTGSGTDATAASSSSGSSTMSTNSGSTRASTGAAAATSTGAAVATLPSLSWLEGSLLMGGWLVAGF